LIKTAFRHERLLQQHSIETPQKHSSYISNICLEIVDLAHVFVVCFGLFNAFGRIFLVVIEESRSFSLFGRYFLSLEFVAIIIKCSGTDDFDAGSSVFLI
jgi:hypothetical protein